MAVHTFTLLLCESTPDSSAADSNAYPCPSFSDVAISAPYENQEGSSVANGTVYVYYGSGSSPVIADAYQQVRGA